MCGRAGIDAKSLIDGVKQDILDKGYTYDDITFSDVQEEMLFGTVKRSDKLLENIFILKEHEGVSAYWDLRTTSKGILGLITLPVKRIIRKLVSFYVEPIVAQQNEVNRLVADSVADLYFDINRMRDRIEFLEKENESLSSMLHDEPDERTAK
ncbi:MAG: hypothetical protein FWE83_00430 [Oscillospiraceae bacterium]|nr:hypothetical protein [Oscillospiraceae bacterium]